jgi:cysteine desulfurase
MQFINLDANASVPPMPKAKEALIQALENQGNASSPHILGRMQRVQLDQARLDVATALGAFEKQVFFNSGASEGNRWLVDALVLADIFAGKKAKVMASVLEHPSLMRPLEKASVEGKINLTFINVNQAGALIFDQALLAEADAIFLTAAHNETGVVTNWSEIMESISAKTILISDAAQAFSRLPMLPDRVDAIVISAHKMGGVVGVGAVLLRGNARKLNAPWTGGSQEGGLRPGSEAIPLICAFGAAAREIGQMRQKYAALSIIRNEIEKTLLTAWPFARVLGRDCHRLANTSAIALSGIDGEALRIAIDTSGVCVGFGSACSALAPEPSAALIAMGLTTAEARATIRISLSVYTAEKDIKAALEKLIPIGQKLAKFHP